MRRPGRLRLCPHADGSIVIVAQEVIIQNFRAKAGTLMADAAEPPLSELLWTVAMARLILGPAMSIQVRVARVG